MRGRIKQIAPVKRIGFDAGVKLVYFPVLVVHVKGGHLDQEVTVPSTLPALYFVLVIGDKQE